MTIGEGYNNKDILQLVQLWLILQVLKYNLFQTLKNIFHSRHLTICQGYGFISQPFNCEIPTEYFRSSWPKVKENVSHIWTDYEECSRMFWDIGLVLVEDTIKK